MLFEHAEQFSDLAPFDHGVSIVLNTAAHFPGNPNEMNLPSLGEKNISRLKWQSTISGDYGDRFGR